MWVILANHNNNFPYENEALGHGGLIKQTLFYYMDTCLMLFNIPYRKCKIS